MPVAVLLEEPSRNFAVEEALKVLARLPFVDLPELPRPGPALEHEAAVIEKVFIDSIHGHPAPALPVPRIFDGHQDPAPR